jgi:hypothetical protein
MGINQGRRPTIARMNGLLLAVAFVSLLSWSPSGGEASDPSSAGSRMLAPGLESSVTRAAPAVTRAQELDRSLDRRSQPPSAIVPFAALALGLIVAAVTVVVRSATGGRPALVVGSRGPPSSLFGPTHRPA